MATIFTIILLLILGFAIAQSPNSRANSKGPPSFEYEYFRRRVENTMDNFWKSVRFELKKYPDSQHALQLLTDHRNALLIDMESLQNSDGYELWRKKEIQDLSEIVQKRFHRLQNPKDCEKARKVLCNPVEQGFGSQIHLLAVCLLTAYATNRTLVLSPENRVYGKPWNELFLPLSETCTSPEGESLGVFTPSESTSDQIEPQVLNVTITDVYTTDFFPLAIPADLAPRLELVHHDPSAWWWSQFVKYVLKLNPTTESALAKKKKALKFKQPIVGIHIRRGDKLGRGKNYYPLEEYMERADAYFERLCMEDKYCRNRRVFISTDDATVIEEARKKYPLPKYKILGDEEVAARGSTMQTRVHDLNGIVMDTFLLSQCSFSVGTFSSNILRIVYELKLAEDPFKHDPFRSDAQVVESLDTKFFLIKPWVDKLRRTYKVVHQHKAGGLELNSGDEIMDFSNPGHLRKGVYFGRNLNTSDMGEYQPFNVKEILRLYNFPSYADE